MSSDAIIRLDHLTKSFGDRTIFEDVTLEVHESEVLAIVGPSGAGKSTLIRCVNHLTEFELGEVSICDQVIRGTDEPGRSKSRRARREAERRIRSQVGMVFQTFNLFPHLTVEHNITLAPTKVRGLSRDDARRRAHELLEAIGLSHRVDAYPQQLSGGERQRVAICRAMAMDPKILLLDEPTSMLDPELVGDVLSTIQGLAQSGMTMMLVTHEMAFARDVADTVIVMADGQIAEAGPAKEVLTNPQSERAKSFLARVLPPSIAPEDAPRVLG